MQNNDNAEIIGTLKMVLSHPVSIFMNMSLLCQMLAFVAVACILAGLVLAILRRINAGPRSGLLAAIGIIGLVAGLLGAAYGGLTTYMAVQAMHVTRLVVYLPSLIEIGYCLVLGVLAWLVAQAGNAGARRG